MNLFRPYIQWTYRLAPLIYYLHFTIPHHYIQWEINTLYARQEYIIVYVHNHAHRSIVTINISQNSYCHLYVGLVCLLYLYRRTLFGLARRDPLGDTSVAHCALHRLVSVSTPPMMNRVNFLSHVAKRAKTFVK